jgi:SecD/SecF fusion protein
MRPFLTRILICVIPCIIAAVVVGVAWSNFEDGNDQGLNFKLGVDLAGGTILVYEVDVDKFTNEEAKSKFDAKELVAALKRRIDPNDLKNVTIRPVGKYRVEIILPTGGHSKKNFTPKEVEDTRALISQVGSLEFRILANQTDDRDAIDAAKAFFDGLNDPAKKEDPIVKAHLAELQVRAAKGLPPPPPMNPHPEDPAEKYLFPWKTPNAEGKASYSWVEVGKVERQGLGLSPESVAVNSPLWKMAEEARQQNHPFIIPTIPVGGGDPFQVLMYSRLYVHKPTSDMEKEDAKNKKFEYFILVRDPLPGKKIDGGYLINASPDSDEKQKPCVSFLFNTAGGALFHDVTTANKPSGGEGGFKRHLAIILDGKIESAPSIISPISTHGRITGGFTKEKVDQLVRIFKAGALPATLKSQAVSENTMGATLGQDTIDQGTRSVGYAFAAILVFMLVYYRFSGLVACTALLANLLLTIGFMVLVHASFTLPGLAGLVLMLGMAVDANVLIYERLREERDRGASLALAIRNGYDRAFPTIIDTHLSSIFTAIVLYAVGNDQLKGFGVSLTAGLIISLFTSLFMTRLLFDIWLAKGWLHKLSMFRLLSKTNIDFMRIRYYWFTATILLTIFGITVFLIRGPNGLNIDFVGGTAYSGQLIQATDITQLRAKLDDKAQHDRLAVASVEELPDENGEGLHYRINYEKGSPEEVRLRNRAPGQTVEERVAFVKKQASEVPDLSVEQIFLRTDPRCVGDKSPYFTVRTTEKEPELVQISIDRLLRENDKSLLQKIDMKAPMVQTKDNKWEDLFTLPASAQVKNARMAVLVFSDFTSPSHVSNLLRQQFQQIDKDDPQPFELNGIKAITAEEHESNPSMGKVGEPADPEFRGLAAQLEITDVEKEGRYKLMQFILSDRAAIKVNNTAALAGILKKARDAFESRPQPERLENFDSQFAGQTQRSAIYAILWSWAVILGYLWFRFGNWTFGLATVACLIHDLFFTLGIIAFSHYIHMWMPGVATLLGMQDFKIDLPAVAALLTLVGYSVNDTIVVFDRIREVRGKNPELTPQMINDSVNQTLSRTLLTAFSVWLVVSVLYFWGGEGVHLFAFVMVVGVIVGTYSSIYIASPLLLIFGEGAKPTSVRERRPEPERVTAE